MATSPKSSGPAMSPGKSSTKHNLLTDEPQSLQRALKAQEDISPRDLSSCTPGRYVSPGIQNLAAQDARLASRSPSGCQPGHHGYHTSAEYGQHQYHTGTSARDRTRISSYRSPFRQPTGAQSSGLASPPEPSERVPVMPQVSAPYASQVPRRSWASMQPSPNQSLHVFFPPYEMLGHQSTNHVYANPPTNVSLALLPSFISWIDQDTVRNYLGIAAVRHKDIHDMVTGECERIVKERQDQMNEDASVLSFAKEHMTVQKILCEEYDDLSNSTKQRIVLQTLGTINQTIMAIPSHVRPSSNWKTKFNAFLTLVWIGKAIIHGTGLLPNAIRAQMVIGSQLVEAIEVVFAMMADAEVLDDGSRLYGALLELNKDRERYFKGLERIVEMFHKVMRQEMTM